MAKKKAVIVHFRPVPTEGTRCGLIIFRATRFKIERNGVTCRNCLNLMRPKIKAPKLTETQRLRLHVKGLEAQIASLTDDYGQLKAEYEKALNHADHIQNLAAEGKDPLSGEEPEVWFVIGQTSDKSPLIRVCLPAEGTSMRETAKGEAERQARDNAGLPFWICPAFDYAVCEVNPVVWKRKSREDAIPKDDEEPPF